MRNVADFDHEQLERWEINAAWQQHVTRVLADSDAASFRDLPKPVAQVLQEQLRLAWVAAKHKRGTETRVAASPGALDSGDPDHNQTAEP